MDINEYLFEAKKTAIYPEHSKVIYPLLGLAGEVGELLNKVKKVYRDHKATEISIHTISAKVLDEIEGELGDIAWYFVNLCKDLYLDPGVILQKNLEKLFSRMERGKLEGSGDER